MVTGSRQLSSGLLVFLTGFLLFFRLGVDGALGQDEPKTVVLDKIPEKFSQWHDQFGFSWQADHYGAVTSGETQYLSSGLKLSVSGTPFEPRSATRKDGTASNGVVDLELFEKRKTISLKRSLWFDQERGGVRVLDELTNTSKVSVTTRVELKTTYPFSWQNLYGTSGEFLTMNPTPILGDRDFGVLVRFSRAEGRHDTLFIVSGGGGAARPALAASSNHRELVFGYDVPLKGGQTVALVHWVVQRNLNDPSDTPEVLAPFYQGRRLVDARVSSGLVGSVFNFGRGSFPKDGGTPLQLDSLVSLNHFIDQLGVHRRDEDIYLLVSANNQLVGKLNQDAEIRVHSEFAGAKTIPIQQIAAIQGGGGMGRVPRVFLRDGRVLSGPFESKNLSLKVGDEWTVDSLQPKELNVLLCALARNDGISPSGTAEFLQIRSGSVLAVSKKSSSILSMVTPWGPLRMPVSEVMELRYISHPSPRYRLVTPDESRLTVFIPDENLPLTLSSGKEVDLRTSRIGRIWKSGRTFVGKVSMDDEWLDYSEIPRDIRPESGILLSGNNILAGSLEKDEIFLIDGSALVKVAVAEIASIRRSLDEGSRFHPVFQFELKNEDVLSGRLRDSSIKIRTGSRVWDIPTAHFIAYRAKEAE